MEIIGVDHGWSSIKTATQIFVTGVKEITTEPPIFSGVLDFRDKYYQIGGERLAIRETKVENDNYYFLTLAAIAMELEQRRKRESEVLLATGLPLTRFGDEKEEFIQYLKREKNISFGFENRGYTVKIKDAVVFPQCYAAIFDKIPSITRKTIVVDLGSWTIDILPISNKRPEIGNCITKQCGLIKCMRSINEECYKQLNGEVDEDVIQQVMRFKGAKGLDEKYTAVITAELKKYCEEVYNTLREYGFNLSTTQIIFVGGGATVMKNFGSYQNENITYVLDVRANAKGYETLVKYALKEKKK